VWGLHSLALIADTGGPLFRSYVEPSLELVMKLITSVSLSSYDLRLATGKMMAALITGMGPELQGSTIRIHSLTNVSTCRSNVCFFSAGGSRETEGMKKSFETACIMLSRPDEHPLCQNEAITCYQRLHLFGGKINYSAVIPVLFVSDSDSK